MKMKANEVRKLSSAELETKLIDLKKDLFNLRLQHATNQLDNPIRIAEVKKDIARVKKEDTCFATTAEVARLLERDFGIDDDYISELSFEAPRIGFECGAVLEPVAAENKNHPVSFGFGLVLEFAGFTYYLSGDTDVLVDNVQCDVLFVVCDGIWNMPDYEKSVPAQVAAMDVLPGLVVPYHYGVDAPSTKENGARLCAALTAAGIPCREWKKGLF